MATIEHPYAKLDGGPVIECSFENTVNAGVNWSAKVLGVNDISGSTPTTHTLEIEGLSCPPLVSTDSETSSFGGYGTTTYSGTDQTSYLLSQDGISLPTMHHKTGSEIINAIAAAAGITVIVGGAVSGMKVEDYDVQGGVVGEHIVRLLRDAACNYRITSGGMEIFDAIPTSGAGAVGEIVPSTTSRKRALAQLYTQVWCRKQSKGKNVVTFPVTKSGMGGGDLGTGLLSSSLSVSVAPGYAGGLAYVAFYTEAGGNGWLCGYRAMMPEFVPGGASFAGVSALIGPVTGVEVAKSCVFSIRPPGFGGSTNLTVIVRGQLPGNSNDYDSSFTVTLPACTVVTDDVTGIVTVTNSGDTAGRKRKLIVESPCWPKKEWIEYNQIPSKLLAEANKGTDTVSAQVKWGTPITVGEIYTIGDLPPARYDSVSYQCSESGFSQKATGWVIH